MDRETLQTVFDFLGPILISTTLFFFYRKIYYHLKFIRLNTPTLHDRTMFGIITNPLTILEHFYVLIPIFIKSEKKKEGEELNLESKIGNSLKTFWILFLLTLILLTILAGLIENVE
ncbi:MAG: hypothetical protein ABJH05_02920 [Fulvivirga sp.]